MLHAISVFNDNIMYVDVDNQEVEVSPIDILLDRYKDFGAEIWKSGLCVMLPIYDEETLNYTGITKPVYPFTSNNGRYVIRAVSDGSYLTWNGHDKVRFKNEAAANKIIDYYAVTLNKEYTTEQYTEETEKEFKCKVLNCSDTTILYMDKDGSTHTIPASDLLIDADKFECKIEQNGLIYIIPLYDLHNNPVGETKHIKPFTVDKPCNSLELSVIRDESTKEYIGWYDNSKKVCADTVIFKDYESAQDYMDYLEYKTNKQYKAVKYLIAKAQGRRFL